MKTFLATIELIVALLVLAILWIIISLLLTNVLKDETTILAITTPLFLLLYIAYIKATLHKFKD